MSARSQLSIVRKSILAVVAGLSAVASGPALAASALSTNIQTVYVAGGAYAGIVILEQNKGNVTYCTATSYNGFLPGQQGCAYWLAPSALVLLDIQ